MRSTKRSAFPLWRPCRGSPSRSKLVLSLHIKGPSYESTDRSVRAVGLFSIGRSPVVWFGCEAAFIMAPAKAPTLPAQRYFITTLGECPQTVREAKPVPDRTFGPAQQRTGHQPSRPQGRVNLRERSLAPLWSHFFPFFPFFPFFLSFFPCFFPFFSFLARSSSASGME